jgi:hypothetical protein
MVTGPWAASIARGRAASCAGLRRWPGLEAAFAGDELWLRGSDLEPDLDRALRQIPGLRRFAQIGDGLLAPVGCLVPTTRLPPAAAWQGIDCIFPPRLPPSRLPALRPAALPFTIERGGGEQAASALLLDAAAPLAAWVEWAAEARLLRLTFARAADGRVLLLSAPLPPLPGLAHWCAGDLVVPCGLRWQPAVPAAVLAEVLRQSSGAEAGSRFLFAADGSWQVLPAAGFVRADRASLRASVDVDPAPDWGGPRQHG